MMLSSAMGETRQDFYWLGGGNGVQQAFHAQAATARDTVFGRRVFVRGVVEVSNYCRQNCHYCAMRRDNHDLARYRLAAGGLARLVLPSPPPSPFVHLQT